MYLVVNGLIILTKKWSNIKKNNSLQNKCLLSQMPFSIQISAHYDMNVIKEM